MNMTGGDTAYIPAGGNYGVLDDDGEEAKS